MPRYLDATLAELCEHGTSVPDEDVQRLTPLVAEHINMLCRYTFTADSVGTPLRLFRNLDENRGTLSKRFPGRV